MAVLEMDQDGLIPLMVFISLGLIVFRHFAYSFRLSSSVFPLKNRKDKTITPQHTEYEKNKTLSNGGHAELVIDTCSDLFVVNITNIEFEIEAYVSFCMDSETAAVALYDLAEHIKDIDKRDLSEDQDDEESDLDEETPPLD